jgi:murein DD-endopeptidase MepM/ murein hydrolase activator NlpD
MRRGGLLERQPKAILSLIIGVVRDPRIRWGPVLTFLASAVLTYALIERLARPPGAEAVTPGGDAGTVEFALPAPEAQPSGESPGRRPESLIAQTASEPRELEEEPVPAERSEPSQVNHKERSVKVVTGRIKKGSTLAQALRGQAVPPQMIDQIARGMRPVFDFRYARAGDSFALVRNGGGKLLSFEFQQGRRDIYRLRPGEGESLVATHREVPLERRTIHLSGKVHGSLFETMVALGEGPDLVHDFADIFAWDIDFSRQTRPGDRFRAVFEKFYDRDGFVRYGKVLAAQYSTGTDTFVAVYFEDDDGYGDYYRPDGSSVRRTFLRAPVRYTRISSRYSKSRYHPILKVRRPHEGVDYAAPVGTPVWAVADGVVIFRGWSGGFGRLVKIRHPNGYVSYYGHLSRYAEGVGKGDRVRQRQVVGYVGTTGLTTGPHLDYRLKANGRFVDPLRVRLPRGKPVYAKNRERFAEERDTLLRELEAAGGVGFALEALR